MKIKNNICNNSLTPPAVGDIFQVSDGFYMIIGDDDTGYSLISLSDGNPWCIPQESIYDLLGHDSDTKAAKRVNAEVIVNGYTE